MKCEYPDSKGSGGYAKGCRCSRCREAKLSLNRRALTRKAKDKANADRKQRRREAGILPKGHKRCGKCQVVKPTSTFPSTKKGKATYGYCKPCHAAYQSALKKKWNAGRKSRAKASDRLSLLRQYGITDQQYNTILKRQGGVCAICKAPPRKTRLAVEHCHSTGMVRGLACPQCNRALAWFRDNAAHMAAASEYIRRSERDHESLSPEDQDQWLLYRGRSSGKLRRARIKKAGAPRPRLPQAEKEYDG